MISGLSFKQLFNLVILMVRCVASFYSCDETPTCTFQINFLQLLTSRQQVWDTYGWLHVGI